MTDVPDTIDPNEWYDAATAAGRLSANSGKQISTDYVRTLARYGKIRKLTLGKRASLYWKADVDTYTVEDRGEHFARTKRQQAFEKRKSETTP